MEGPGSEVLPFKFDFQFNRPWPRKLFPLIEAPLERALSFPRLNSMYSQMAGGSDDRSFFERSLARLRIGCQVSELDRPVCPDGDRPWWSPTTLLGESKGSFWPTCSSRSGRM